MENFWMVLAEIEIDFKTLFCANSFKICCVIRTLDMSKCKHTDKKRPRYDVNNGFEVEPGALLFVINPHFLHLYIL